MVSFYDSDLEASGAEPLAQQAAASLHYGGWIFLYRFAGCKVSPFASLEDRTAESNRVIEKEKQPPEPRRYEP